jgi:hypothetical protein
LIHSSAYHSETNGQTQRVIQILEDMLRNCVLEHQGSGIRVYPGRILLQQ